MRTIVVEAAHPHPGQPNAVSLASIAIGLVAAWFFAVGSHQAAILAAVLFQFSAIVDCVDGDLARVLFKESPLGKWLDLAGDQVVHVAVFAAIAIGLVRGGETPFAFGLGISAVLGAVISFAVVVRGMRQPANDRSLLLQKLIDSATNRDFSVLVLVLACFNRLEWFLWLSAIGSHVFWITALALQLGSHAKETPAR
jgi:1L-myo-inositol 1-phosphate cytidylyltransferase / CDP-L-myo-inositol myo-inositolphosphotransferase